MRTIIFILLFASAAPSQAQELSYGPYAANNPNLGLNQGAVNLPNTFVQAFQCPQAALGGGLSCTAGFINIGQILAAQPVVAGPQGPAGPQGATGSQGVAGPPGPAGETNAAALVAIASRLDRLAGRFREGIALAGAVNVLPPNPGDRFAVSFGGAGYDGAGAGSVAVSARIDERTIAYIGYARGPTQNLVKGGIGLSFR